MTNACDRVGPTARTTVTQWRVVRCPICDKTFCEATPGTTVKWRCRYCKIWVVREAA